MHRRTALRIVISSLAAGAASSCGRKKHAATRPLPPPAPASIASTETGIASWYGHPYHGRPAADGEIYDMEKLTAAHRTLPFNTWVRVTNLTNAKSVEVRIIDRGPFIDGRIIDLSHAAARAIDLIGPGTAPVRVDVMSTLSAASSTGALFAVQAAAYADRNRAERLRGTLDREFGAARIVLRDGAPPQYRVLVGSERTIAEANLLARKIAMQTGSGFVVRLDENAPGSASTAAR